MDTTLTYSNIGEILTGQVPELQSSYEEALYDDELMVHVFLGYVAIYVKSQSRLYMEESDNQVEIKNRIDTIFKVMTRALIGNSNKLVGAVVASFLEGLDTTDASLFRVMVDMMDDELKEAIKELTDFYHSSEWRTFVRRLDG